MNSINDLATLTPDLSAISILSKKYGLVGFYIYTLESNINGRDASTRMFAPFYGITEEAATGMAAGPLACYLYDYMDINKKAILIEQGYAMTPASPSCIEVVLEIENNTITSLKAGGVGKPSRHLEVEI